MKLRSLGRIVLTFAFTALASRALANPAVQIGGYESTALAQAKAKYESDLQALTDDLTKWVTQERLKLTPVEGRSARFDLVAVNEMALRMEQETRLLALEGEWPASAATELGSLSKQRTNTSKMEAAYKTAYQAAVSAGDSKAQDCYTTELTAFLGVTDLAKWRELLNAASAAAGAPEWIRSNGGLLSPNPKESNAVPGALRVLASAVPWRPQYKLQLVIERVDAGESLRFSILDSAGRPVDFRLSASALNTALANRVFGKSGACLVFTVQDTMVKLEVEGRTLELKSTESTGSSSDDPAPTTPLLEISPEGGARIRLMSIAWRPLRGIKAIHQESIGADAETAAAAADCASRQPVDMASVMDLRRAKVAYEEALLELQRDVDAEFEALKRPTIGEEASKVKERVRLLDSEAQVFETEGVWPASLHTGLSNVVGVEKTIKPLRVAYWKAASEANRLSETCTRIRLVSEFDAFQRHTDFAKWRPMFENNVDSRHFDAEHPILPLKYHGPVPARYKIEFLISREGDGDGFLVRGMEPASGLFEYHVSKFDLDVGVKGGVFGKPGARFLVVAEPGYARIEMEGKTLWQRPSDQEPAAVPPAALADCWLELIPDDGTALLAKPVRWKPLVALPGFEEVAPNPQRPAAGAARTKPGIATGPAREGLEWLRWHQSANGSWDCNGFMSNCGHLLVGSTCRDPGEAGDDLGMTGLAVLAFLGGGSSTIEGPYKDQVAKAIQWIITKQDADSGLYGEKLGQKFMYNHAIAALAVCEALLSDPTLKDSAQKAIGFIERSRNPYAAWQYASPPDGQNDTSVTGWCVITLASARDAGLTVDNECFVGAKNWIDEMTDPATGRTGYDARGSPSARVRGKNDQYSVDGGEAMTALSLRVRPLFEKRGAKDPISKQQIDLLSARLPEWTASGFSNDIYYWYHGTCALSQAKGKPWESWKKAVVKALTDHQSSSGDEKGSWTPQDAWGFCGGRIYMTAMAVLCLEEVTRTR